MKVNVQSLYGPSARRPPYRFPGLLAQASSPQKQMLARVSLLLLRAAFLGLALYGIWYSNDVYAVLFGILFLHTLLYPQFYLKPNLLEAYLLFTVVFYFYRFVMGWDPSGLIYMETGPVWVRVVKDVVWIAFVFVVATRGLLRRGFNRSTPLWFTSRGRLMALATLIYIVIPIVGLNYHGGWSFNNILLNLRYPLEYVPFVFLLPFILRGESSIRYLKAFIPLVLLALAFLPYEMFSGHGHESFFGGIYFRYGSIFGSPNTFGNFMMLSLTFLLALLVERALQFSPRVISLFLGCLCGLASSISLSSILSSFFSFAGLAVLSKRKLALLLILVSAAGMGTGLYYFSSETGVNRYLTERVQNLSTLRDKSAYLHAQGLEDTWKDITNFSGTEYLLGTAKEGAALGAPETYYERTVYLRGVPELLVLLFMIGLSVYEARQRYYLAAGNPLQRGVWLGCQLTICSYAFACSFIPYLDMFPSNFYFWFLVAIVWAEPMRNKGSSPKPGDQSQRRGARQAYAEVETLASNNLLS